MGIDLKKVIEDIGQVIKSRINSGDHLGDVLDALRDCQGAFHDGMNDGATFALHNKDDIAVLEAMRDLAIEASEQATEGMTQEELDHHDNWGPGKYAQGFCLAMMYALGHPEEKQAILEGATNQGEKTRRLKQPFSFTNFDPSNPDHVRQIVNRLLADDDDGEGFDDGYKLGMEISAGCEMHSLSEDKIRAMLDLQQLAHDALETAVELGTYLPYPRSFYLGLNLCLPENSDIEHILESDKRYNFTDLITC